MRANELMIGDWVSYKGIYTRVAPADFDIHHEKWIEDIVPIPLTPEILEKNGFVYDSKDKLFEDIYPRISMLYAQYRLVENGCINYGEMSEIKYVHELQHALRLCGINHEIIL